MEKLRFTQLIEIESLAASDLSLNNHLGQMLHKSLQKDTK